MAYLIPCSSKKNCMVNDIDVQISSLENLNEFKGLYELRKELINKLSINLNWNFTKPALEVYNGKIYIEIKRENYWLKPKTDIIIVSALFGLLKPTELIPYYNVKMDSFIPNTKMKISKFWLNNNLFSFLPECNNVDLLSKPYRKAFNNKNIHIGQEVNEKWKDNYGKHKGVWLNKQLENLHK